MPIEVESRLLHHSKSLGWYVQHPLTPFQILVSPLMLASYTIPNLGGRHLFFSSYTIPNLGATNQDVVLYPFVADKWSNSNIDENQHPDSIWTWKFASAE